MTKLIVYCAGAFGQEILEIAREFNNQEKAWNHVRFIDDVISAGTSIQGIEVLSFDDLIALAKVESHLSIIVANGNPVSRADLIFKLQQNNLDNLLTSIISPRAYISPTAQIERGVVVCTGSLVSVNAKIEENSVVYHQSLVGHGAKIQKNCFISSMVNIAGNVKIGANTFIGMGALIREGVTIGHDVVIGMGSVVTKDIPDGMLAYGNPARVVRNSSQGNLYRKE